jgi:hypothetical protein
MGREPTATKEEKGMLSKKIRTGAAGLAATFALAAAAAAGAMAEKPTKWGHLGIGQAGHITVNDGNCGDWMSLYNASIDQMHSDIAAGDYGDAFQQLDQAAANRSTAHDAGCGWAWT